jgi:hypothetical protein
VADWERRYHLTLAQDARESWTNGMIELADRLIKAHEKEWSLLARPDLSAG